MGSCPIAVLASGRGSNLDAILGAIRDGRLDAEIVAVFSDRPEAPVVEKARTAGLRTFSAQSAPGEQRRAFDARMSNFLAPYGPRFLVLAGYMRVLSDELIEEFRSERGYSRIVNVHPSLLPAFPGMHSYAQAFHYGAPLAGVSVHLVESEVDRGPLCAQEAFPIQACRSVGEVERLGLAIEHRLYPATLSWVLPEKFDVEYRAEFQRRGSRAGWSGVDRAELQRRLCVRPR